MIVAVKSCRTEDFQRMIPTNAFNEIEWRFIPVEQGL
jgi:hypothetical protein